MSFDIKLDDNGKQVIYLPIHCHKKNVGWYRLILMSLYIPLCVVLSDFLSGFVILLRYYSIFSIS